MQTWQGNPQTRSGDPLAKPTGPLCPAGALFTELTEQKGHRSRLQTLPGRRYQLTGTRQGSAAGLATGRGAVWPGQGQHGSSTPSGEPGECQGAGGSTVRNRQPHRICSSHPMPGRDSRTL